VSQINPRAAYMVFSCFHVMLDANLSFVGLIIKIFSWRVLKKTILTWIKFCYCCRRNSSYSITTSSINRNCNVRGMSAIVSAYTRMYSFCFHGDYLLFIRDYYNKLINRFYVTHSAFHAVQSPDQCSADTSWSWISRDDALARS